MAHDLRRRADGARRSDEPRHAAVPRTLGQAGGLGLWWREAPLAGLGLACVLLALWGLAAAEFALRPDGGRNLAGWALVAGVPALWAVKSAALVLNAKGRAIVSGISDPRSWRRIGLARLPIAFGLAALVCFA